MNITLSIYVFLAPHYLTTLQHFVFTVVRMIDLLIPDVPEKLEALIHLEDSFAREMMKEVIEVRIVN